MSNIYNPLPEGFFCSQAVIIKINAFLLLLEQVHEVHSPCPPDLKEQGEKDIFTHSGDNYFFMGTALSICDVYLTYIKSAVFSLF